MTVSLGILSTTHFHSQLYAQAIEAVDRAELVAVADEEEARGQAFATTYDIEYADRDEVLETVDAAIVTSANTAHQEWIDAAAAAGVDVLCEKPLATSAGTAREIVDRCAEAGVTLGLAMPVRFSEPAIRVKAAIDRGDIGDVQLMTGTNLLRKMSGDTWITDPALSGGGAIMDHIVHVVDLARWFTGMEVTEVFAESGTHFSPIDVEDIAVVSMAMEDGTPLTQDGSWRQPNEWDFWGDLTMRIVGTDGVLELDCFDQTLTVTRDNEEDPGIESVYWGSDINAGLIRDFTAAVERDGQPAVTGIDGLREVEVIEAAYRSLETGSVETIADTT